MQIACHLESIIASVSKGLLEAEWKKVVEIRADGISKSLLEVEWEKTAKIGVDGKNDNFSRFEKDNGIV